MTIFDSPHIIVVFAPGASGNFLVSLLSGLVNDTHTEFSIAKSGSSHTVSPNDDISLGMFITPEFKTASEKIDHYRSLISSAHTNDSATYITWSHNFSNIPLYREIFPNAKVIAITQSETSERLTVTFMHVIKNLIDEAVSVPIQNTKFDAIRNNWKNVCAESLKHKFSSTQIDSIFTDTKYSNLVLYLYMRRMLVYYGLLHLVEDVKKTPPIQSSTSILSNNPYDIKEFITSNCTELPYSYLVLNNVELLINAIVKVLGRELNSNEKIFIQTSFIKYRQAQDLKCLEDPVEYYNLVKHMANKLIMEIT